jgi:hypothetical protein
LIIGKKYLMFYLGTRAVSLKMLESFPQNRYSVAKFRSYKKGGFSDGFQAMENS